MRLTFLESRHVRLAKMYTRSTTTAYPLAKNFYSHEYFIPKTIEGLRDKTTLLQKHARFGQALLKGPLFKILVDESRANQTDNAAATSNIVIDIDGFALHDEDMVPPLTQSKLENIAEKIVRLLPKEFRDISYIVHASSSMGLKPGKVSLHLDFLLENEMDPANLKQWLILMNIDIPHFKEQLDLTATGTALRYKLDITLADNSRIIYIAPPIFEEITDPIPNPDDRIFLVEKPGGIAVDNRQRAVAKNTLQKRIQEEVNYLRERKGLPESLAHTSAYRFENHLHQVVTNPDATKLVFAYEKDSRAYYNINEGDSRAYYVYKTKPQVVWNFKGEPPFLFETADPETYQWHLDTFVRGDTEAEKSFDPDPIIFNDLLTDTYYRGLINPLTNSVVTIQPTHRGMLDEWMAQYNGVKPPFVPTWQYIFDPTDQRSVDKRNKFINRYLPTEMMRKPADIPDKFKNLAYETGMELENLCPNIFKLLRSVTGNVYGLPIELKHFINWFAYIVCTKKKTCTAWIFHGTEGTGKGVLFEHVIRPILGSDYAIQVRLEDIDENFNAWLETAIFVMVDEFKFANAKNQSAVMAKMRNYITEPTLSIRGMRQNSRQVRSFCNIMITGNERDMARPSDEDRRYNVCPRQEEKLFNIYPELRNNIEIIEAEVPAFCSALLHYHYNENMARTALENEAKDILRSAARTTEEDFLVAMRTGDLDYFADIMGYDLDNGIRDHLLAAKNIVRLILDKFEPEPEKTPRGEDRGDVSLFTDELLILYRVLVADNSMTPDAFGKKLRRNGWETRPVRRFEDQRRGVTIKFRTAQLDRLKELYLLRPASSNKVTQFPGASVR